MTKRKNKIFIFIAAVISLMFTITNAWDTEEQKIMERVKNTLIIREGIKPDGMKARGPNDLSIFRREVENVNQLIEIPLLTELDKKILSNKILNSKIKLQDDLGYKHNNGIISARKDFIDMDEEEKKDFLELSIRSISKKIESLVKEEELRKKGYFLKNDKVYYSYNAIESYKDDDSDDSYAPLFMMFDNYFLLTIENGNANLKEKIKMNDEDVFIEEIKRINAVTNGDDIDVIDEKFIGKNKIYKSDLIKEDLLEKFNGIIDNEVDIYDGTIIKLYRSSLNTKSKLYNKLSSEEKKEFDRMPDLFLELKVIKDKMIIVDSVNNKFNEYDFLEKVDKINSLSDDILNNKELKEYYSEKIKEKVYTSMEKDDEWYYHERVLKDLFFNLTIPFKIRSSERNRSNNSGKINFFNEIKNNYSVFSDLYYSEDLWLYLAYRLDEDKFVKYFNEKIFKIVDKAIRNKKEAISLKNNLQSLLNDFDELPEAEEMKNIKVSVKSMDYRKEIFFDKKEYYNNWTQWQKFLYREEMKSPGFIKHIKNTIENLIKKIDNDWNIVNKKGIFLNSVSWWDGSGKRNGDINFIFSLDNLKKIDDNDELFVKLKWNGTNDSCGGRYSLAKSGEVFFEIPRRIYQKSNGWLRYDDVDLSLSKSDIFFDDCDKYNDYDIRLSAEVYKKDNEIDSLLDIKYFDIFKYDYNNKNNLYY